MVKRNKTNWWKVAYLTGVTIFALGCAVIVGNMIYIVAMTLVRAGAPMIVITICIGMVLALVGAIIAGMSEKKSKGQ